MFTAAESRVIRLTGVLFNEPSRETARNKQSNSSGAHGIVSFIFSFSLLFLRSLFSLSLSLSLSPRRFTLGEGETATTASEKEGGGDARRARPLEREVRALSVANCSNH